MALQICADAGIDRRIAFPPWRLSGVVIGAALNDPAQLAALGAAVHAAPYKAPPRAPVLAVKPRHTLRGSGAAVALPPAAAAGIEVGATLGLVIGRETCRVAAEQALASVAGWALVADLSLPLDSHYRPGARFKALDASCLVGTAVAARPGFDPQASALRLRVDGAAVIEVSMTGMTRPAAQLLADVSEFMTLNAGDLLLLGVRSGAPRLRAGQRFSIEAPALGRLDGQVVAATAQAAP